VSDKSGIEWTEATWNPVTGCSKVSQGCKNCYAERDWGRLSKIGGNVYTGRAFTDVMCHPERLDQPLRWKKPRRIFVNSMSDLFHESVPDSFIDKVFAVMALAERHTFQVLTKRPARMLSYFLSGPKEHTVKGEAWEMLGHYPKYPNAGMKAPWPLPNVWLGVSVEDQATADERIPLLLDTPSAVRWISAEPLLESVDLTDLTVSLPDGVAQWNALHFDNDRGDCAPYGSATIDWIVVGGESGPNARPMRPDWVRSLRDQCQASGVPFFFKQWGEWSNAGSQRPGASGMFAVVSDNGFWLTTNYPRPFNSFGSSVLSRIGKKAAGRMLDGRTWDEYPK